MPSWSCHSEPRPGRPGARIGPALVGLDWLLPHRLVPLLLVLVLSLLWATSAAAATPVLVLTAESPAQTPLRPYLSILRDPTGSLSVDAVRAQDQAFQALPAGSGLNLSYSTDTIWLRLRLRSAHSTSERWLAEFDYASLDHADLFDGDRPVQTAGDRVPFSARAMPHRNPLFSVTLAPGEERELLWRVRSEGSLTINPSLWVPTAFARHSQHAYAAHAFYFGMLVALAGYNLLLFAVLRERVYLLYVGFVLGVGVGIGSIYGLAAEFLWPEWVDWSNRALVVSFAFAGIVGPLFTRDFLGTAERAAGWHRWLGIGALAHVGMVAIGLLASMRIGMQLMSISTIFNCLLMWGCGIVCLRRGVPGARLFVLSWAILLLGGILMGLRNFGLLPTNQTTLYAMEIGSALEMLLLSFALAARFDQIKHERAQAQTAALAAQQALVTSLQRQERELEQRVAERTEALAQANARLQSLAALDPLTGLGNRSALYSWLSELLSRPGQPFALLLIDLDGFKAVNDRHGHATGDQLLVELAERWHAGLKPGDRLARLGGDEFVLVSESAPSASAAQALAEALRLAVRAPLKSAPSAELDASIGVAFRDGDNEHADAILRRADHAMYRAKAEGRGRVEFA